MGVVTNTFHNLTPPNDKVLNPSLKTSSALTRQWGFEVVYEPQKTTIARQWRNQGHIFGGGAKRVCPGQEEGKRVWPLEAWYHFQCQTSISSLRCYNSDISYETGKR